jgi:hypothetical protein
MKKCEVNKKRGTYGGAKKIALKSFAYDISNFWGQISLPTVS